MEFEMTLGTLINAMTSLRDDMESFPDRIRSVEMAEDDAVYWFDAGERAYARTLHEFEMAASAAEEGDTWAVNRLPRLVVNLVRYRAEMAHWRDEIEFQQEVQSGLRAYQETTWNTYFGLKSRLQRELKSMPSYLNEVLDWIEGFEESQDDWVPFHGKYIPLQDYDLISTDWNVPRFGAWKSGPVRDRDPGRKAKPHPSKPKGKRFADRRPRHT
jgi:hypothetical protein